MTATWRPCGATCPRRSGCLRWYTSYLDERGTITDVPEWNLVDWASIFVSGRSSILTALWARGLDRVRGVG